MNKKIYCVGMVKNEADIIESFIRYNENIFDLFIILDDFSTDNTLKILNSLKNEGKNIIILNNDEYGWAQDKKTTELIYYAASGNDFEKPDYIIALDADEFIYDAIDGKNPRKLISSLDTGKYYKIKWSSFVPYKIDNNELFILKRIKYMRPENNADRYKVIIPADIIKENFSIHNGNHDIGVGYDVESEILYNIKLAHFPIRGIQQAKAKALISHLNHLANPSYIEGSDWHIGHIYNEIKNGREVNLKSVIDMAKNYVLTKPLENDEFDYNPLNLSFCSDINIRHTTADETDAFKLLLTYCEGLARSLAEASRRGGAKQDDGSSATNALLLQYRDAAIKTSKWAQRTDIYYKLTDKWFDLYIRKVNPGNWFEKNGIKNIAIYGLGGIGKRLYEQLKNSDINVKAFIESTVHPEGEPIYDGLPVIPVKELGNFNTEDIDAIVVTPIHVIIEIMDNILNSIGYNERLKIISFEDIINELVICEN